MMIFLCLLMQAILIPLTGIVFLRVVVFFRIQPAEAVAIRMMISTHHNGWWVVVVIWTVVWTIVGWSHPAFVSPLESWNAAEIAADTIGGETNDRKVAIERLDRVSGVLQLGSLVEWANPEDEKSEEPTWRGSAAVASWILFIAGTLWVWSDDVLAALGVLFAMLFSRQTESASVAGGSGEQQAAATPTSAPSAGAGASSWFSQVWNRYSDDLFAELVFKLPELWRHLKTVLNRR